MTAPPIPASSSDLDRDWIAAALHTGGLATNAALGGVSFEPLGGAVGLMGDLLRCRLHWSEADDQLPSSLVIKLPSLSEGNRALALAMGYYEAEHCFYRDLAGGLGMRTPRCWYTDGDGAAGRYALLLDDISHLDAFDQSDGLDAERSAVALTRLAQLHGRTWLDPALEGLAWLPNGRGDDIRVYGLFMNDAWPAWAAAAAGVVDAESIALAERFVRNFDFVVDEGAEVPWSLMHRDFRVDNMLFDGTEPVVFDWGGTARGSGLYDLAYFLGGSLTTEVRRANHDSLLRVYRDALDDAGGDPLDDADFERQLRHAALLCLIVPILAGGDIIDPADDRGRALVSTILARTFDLLRDLDAGASLPA